jgi:ribonuclease J
LDHIGAAPILLEKLGYPPVVGRDLTLALVKDRLEDYKKGSVQKLKTINIKDMGQKVNLGRFKAGFFQIEHSIMDAVGVALETPAGTIIHPGDWMMDRNEKGVPNIDYYHLRKYPNPKVLMLESLGSTRSDQPGLSRDVYANLYEVMSRAEGRLVIGTFASQIERVKWLIETAGKIGRKVMLDGYSMKKNVEIAKRLGYIKFPKNAVLDASKIKDYPDNKIILICTGAQGEERAVLSRIVNREHRFVKLKKSDTVIFSSSVIPGNERVIQRLKDNMYRQSDNVIHSEIMDVHISGHANRRDIVEVIKMVKPTYFIPVYANHYFLKEAAKLACENGFPKNRVIVPDNGSIISMDKQGARMLKEKAPSDYVFVDGLGVTEMQNVVLRDRQVLAEDGMVVLIVTVNAKSGKLVQNPDIISRGFVYLKENKQLIEELRGKVKKIVIASRPESWADTDQIKNDVRERVGQFLFQKTQKRPMILPVVIEV